MKNFLKTTITTGVIALAAVPLCHAQNAGLTSPLNAVNSFLVASPLPLAQLGDLAVIGELAGALPLDSVLDIVGTSATQLYSVTDVLVNPGSGTPDLGALVAIPTNLLGTLNSGNLIDPTTVTGFLTDGTLEGVIETLVSILDPTALLDIGSLTNLGNSLDTSALLNPAILPGLGTLIPIDQLGSDNFDLFIPVL